MKPDSDLVSSQKEPTVYVFNMSEDVWQFISAMTDKKTQEKEIIWNSYLCERDLFSFADEDHIVFIFPYDISRDFLEYYITLFGKKDFTILVPKKNSGEICIDSLIDKMLMQKLISTTNGHRKLTLLSYATTPQLFDLVHALEKQGLIVNLKESPDEEDSWTVNFFGSKSGIRQLSQKSLREEPDFRMSDGSIVMGIVDAAKIAASMYGRERGVVLKTNKGHSGMGILIYRNGELPNDFHTCVQTLIERLAKEAYWSKFPIVIEELIPINASVGNGFPSIEFYINKAGKVNFLYYCTLRVTKQGEFQGIEIHEDILADNVKARMLDTGFFIGEKFSQSGYRGYFDIDFAAGKNGELYVTETNIRRTGGTHVYKTAKKLFGENFLLESYILSNNSLDIHESYNSFAQLHDRLLPLLFDKKTREGIILCSEQLLSLHKMAYIIFAPTKKRSYEIEAQMIQLVQ